MDKRYNKRQTFQRIIYQHGKLYNAAMTPPWTDWEHDFVFIIFIYQSDATRRWSFNVNLHSKVAQNIYKDVIQVIVARFKWRRISFLFSASSLQTPRFGGIAVHLKCFLMPRKSVKHFWTLWIPVLKENTAIYRLKSRLWAFNGHFKLPKCGDWKAGYIEYIRRLDKESLVLSLAWSTAKTWATVADYWWYH